MSSLAQPRLSAQETLEILQNMPASTRAALSKAEKLELLKLIDELEEQILRENVTKARSSILPFAHSVYPGFKEGPQHRVMAKVFDDVVRGVKRRVIINIAPRHSKSEFTSYLLPAYFLGHYPDKKIIMATHTASLSEDFGRRVRNLIQTEEYAKIFPDTSVAHDQKASGKWSTGAGGQYYAVGVGGALAGRGADLLVVDDPHALPLDTEVPTPQGFKTVAALRVGDEVFGPDGVPTRVIGKSDVYPDRALYAVTTDDGEIVHCDAMHRWTYHSETNLKKAHLVKTDTAVGLAAWDKPNKPYLPRHAAVQYPVAELPVDPYVLGAWLGDGTTGLGRMTAHPDDQPFMRSQFEAAGYVVTDQADAYSFGVLGLRKQLEALGVRDKKKVPAQYMTASVEQRMALLQGLMDTDGDVTAAGQCNFNNCDEGLVLAVRELVHSLGVKAKVHTYFDARQNHRPVYRVTFKLANCCRMPRKCERTYTPTDKRRRSITVKATEVRADVQCITVARKDGLFLVGRGYVVTHNSEQDVVSNAKATFENAWTWFQTGPFQRLMPGGAILVVMTRWGTSDLSGKLLKQYINDTTDNVEPWEVVELPALLDENTDKERPLWPEFWSLGELRAKRASMDRRYWGAQYQQKPTDDEGALIKRESWRVWTKDEPPKCSYVIQSWDTAYLAKETADFNACTTWGVFTLPDDKGKEQNHIMLLNAFKARMEFPELKKTALKHFREWEPDTCIIEAKAAGLPLIQEFRMIGVPVQDFTPSRGNDKTVRVNAVADMFASGLVWCPDRPWAHEVQDECAAFPNGDHDDYVDTVTAALLRFRRGGFVRLPDEEQDDDQPRYVKNNALYRVTG